MKAKPNSEPELEYEDEVKPQRKRRLWRRPSFWLVTILVLIILAGGAVLVFRHHQVGRTQAAMADGWNQLGIQSDQVDDYLKPDLSAAGLGDVTRELRHLDSLTKDKLYAANTLPTLLNDKSLRTAYSAFLTKFEAYVKKAADLSADIQSYDDSAASDLSDKADVAKQASIEVKGKISHLPRELPDQIFSVSERLTAVKKAVEDAKAAAEAEKLKQTQKSAEDAANQEAAKTSVTKFMDAFIAGNAALMKRYMTDAYIKEYDFNQVSDDQRQYTYPASYRLVLNEKSGDSFEIQINTTYKYRTPPEGGSDQYTQTATYVVIKSGSSWLINASRSSGAGTY